jgi:cellulose synthase/poly-beta-1,6-N-acetylglucosamine synthase-like glycosyltransferase
MMTFLFWTGVAWLGYVYAGYPLILALFTRIRRVRPEMRSEFLPTVSVLIAARNEEKDIGWKVEETLRWDYPSERLEILVASDASEDRTDEIVRGIKDARLIFLRLETRGGKNKALNRLVERARGELFFFTDANAHIAPECLRRVVRHFADARVGCVTGDTHFGHEESSVVGQGAGVYSGYESAIRHLEGELGSVLTCDGALFCMRRSLFEPLHPELANDLELPLRVRSAGYWVRHEPGAKVLEKDTRSPWESFTQRRRIAAQGMLAMWRLRRLLTGVCGWQFISRKFLRWLTFVPILLVTISTIARVTTPAYAATLVLQIIFYGLALVGLIQALNGWSASRYVSVPFYMLLGSLSTLAGMMDACVGRRFAVWEIPKLSRGQGEGTWQNVH